VLAIDSPTYVFDLSGNHLSLNFVNTGEARDGQSHERLGRYADLVAWSLQSQILTPQQASQLLSRAEQQPLLAEAARERAITLREVLFRIYYALVQDIAPVAADLATFNAALKDALAHMCVLQVGDGFAWGWSQQEERLDWPLWPVLHATADLLVSPERDRVHICEDESCDWLFLDTSKNRSRRWCNMRTCGNRAKARRHYERTKETSS
jgi:predicted RNA-binding Zn ribbon-like protein